MRTGQADHCIVKFSYHVVKCTQQVERGYVEETHYEDPSKFWEQQEVTCFLVLIDRGNPVKVIWCNTYTTVSLVQSVGQATVWCGTSTQPLCRLTAR